MFANWTIDGAQHQKNNKWLNRQNLAFLNNTQDLLQQEKVKFTSSPQSIYFIHFAMRYPVICSLLFQWFCMFDSYVIYLVHPWSPVKPRVFIWLVFISWGHFDVVGCTREVRFEIVYLGVCPEYEITEIEIDRILFLSCLGFACVPSFFLTNKKGYISNHKRIKTCYFSWFHQPKFLSEMLLSTCYFLC